MALQPCPSCSRHVRSTETACPFCAASLALTASPAPMTSERLGRAALFAFGAAMATNVAACSMSTTPASDAGPGNDVSDFAPDSGTDAPTPVPDSGFFPPYGTPAPDAGTDTGGLAGAYGAPPPRDGGP